MATIIAKFLSLIQPDQIFMGKKDYQQYLIVKRLALDLNMDVAVEGVETHRESDGLAMSSRNVHLKGQARTKAPMIHQELSKVAAKVATKDFDEVANQIKQSKQKLTQEGFDVEYLSVCDALTLKAITTKFSESIVVLCAAKIGTTRLIDNLECV